MHATLLFNTHAIFSWSAQCLASVTGKNATLTESALAARSTFPPTSSRQPRTQRSRKPLEPQTHAQGAYLNAIEVYDLVFCMGPAGTGKTYVATARAAEALDPSDIKKIIITRPAVGAEEEYGFLPGELEEKIAPWAAPVIAILEERLGQALVEYMLDSQDHRDRTARHAPRPHVQRRLGHLRRGAERDRQADEAVPHPLRQELQDDRRRRPLRSVRPPEGALSGFIDAWELMRGHKNVGFIEFTLDDIVRSGMCREILLRYSKKGTPTLVFGFHAPSFLSQPAG
jgi:phosphate starvation-inducible PhoH-like protein